MSNIEKMSTTRDAREFVHRIMGKAARRHLANCKRSARRAARVANNRALDGFGCAERATNRLF